MPEPIVPAATPIQAAPAAPAMPAPAAVVPVPAAQPKPVTPASPAPGQPAPAPTMVPLPALQEERDRRQALQAELDTLRRQNLAPQQQPQAIAQVDPRVELEKLWENDPRKAVQVEIMYAMDWRDRQEASLNSQADQMALKYPDFNNYRSAALSHIRSLPAHQRGMAGIMEASYYMVRGQNMDQYVQQREQEWLARYQQGQAPAGFQMPAAGGYSAPAVQAGTVMLNADQLKVAEMMGLTPEMYASQITMQAPAGGSR